MLLQLSSVLESSWGILSAVQYLSLRAILSALTAFGVSLLFGPGLVRWYTARNISQSVRALGPQSHQSKDGTPTMGGVLILASVFGSVLLWGDLSNRYLWLVMGVTFVFGLIGWFDDHCKVTKSSSAGLSARLKLFWQSVAALSAAGVLLYLATSPSHTHLLMPFFKNVALDLGAVGFVLFSSLVIIGSSNAVNLTDGLDGLAIMPVVMVGGALGIIAYLAGHVGFSEYLYIPYVPDSGELAIFCAALCGGGLGFLWFNTYPAQIFMGDVGALALGAALGTLAIITRHELVFCLMSGIFVLETVSVIAQVASYKLTGRRVFMMAPIHHHFELKGWPEPRVIVRFWIITVMLVLTGLATLKLR